MRGSSSAYRTYVIAIYLLLRMIKSMNAERLTCLVGRLRGVFSNKLDWVCQTKSIHRKANILTPYQNLVQYEYTSTILAKLNNSPQSMTSLKMPTKPLWLKNHVEAEEGFCFIEFMTS